MICQLGSGVNLEGTVFGERGRTFRTPRLGKQIVPRRLSVGVRADMEHTDQRSWRVSEIDDCMRMLPRRSTR